MPLYDRSRGCEGTLCGCDTGLREPSRLGRGSRELKTDDKDRHTVSAAMRSRSPSTAPPGQVPT